MAIPKNSSPQVVVFPHLAQGHTLPLLDLSKAIASFGVQVIIITTPKNAPTIESKVDQNPGISVAILPFATVQGLPEGCENTADLPSMDLFIPFMKATKSLRQPFQDLLGKMCQSNGRPPLCVISDFFLGWTLDVCNSLGIPRIVFHGMGVLTSAVSKIVFGDVPRVMAIPDVDPIQLPILDHVPFPVYKSDVPSLEMFKNPNDPWLLFLTETLDTDPNSWGVMMNSFEELEGDYVNLLDSFYNNGAKAWCVGPGLLWDQPDDKKKSYHYINWLDERSGANDGVIYVSFGTQSHVSDAQMDEVARGLEMAGQSFIWVVRSQTWMCSDKGWEERVTGKLGLVLRDWVDQRLILSHPRVHGFLSHCGWNSVIESLSYGVPILTWPMGYDQPLNAKAVAMKFGAGVMVKEWNQGGIVEAHVISEGVKELMEGEGGKKARESAGKIGKKAQEAVRKGGSSYQKLEEMINCLKKRQCERSLY